MEDKEYNEHKERVKALLEFNTANLEFIENESKDREITIRWVDFAIDDEILG